MSYINDALSKVQKERKSPYSEYGDVLSAEGKRPARGRKWVLAAGLMVTVFLAAGLAAWHYWPAPVPASRAASPVLQPVQQPDDVAVPSLPGAPPAAIAKEPAPPPGSAEIAPPAPAPLERAPAAGKSPAPEGKEKKQSAVITGPEPERESSPRPAPADTEKLYGQALQKQREGQLEEAKELYKVVIRREPRHLQALNNLGVVYLKMKRYRWAIIRFNDALNINHNYVDAHYNLACLYAQKNDTKQSLFYLRNAVDLNPEVRLWARQDDDLKNLANLPEFNKILQARDK
ncbi:MAG: tetratricopeptide repeat protein [Deltaproteobacteria bacterium]